MHGEAAGEGNTYNHNFANQFCGCGEVYDAYKEKGTMFQCLGLATETDGGCGEDWWHPECITGIGREWSQKVNGHAKAEKKPVEAAIDSNEEEDEEEKSTPLPPGFPEEDDFDAFICYKCVEANPWIKRYAGSPGFLPPIYHEPPSAPAVTPTNIDTNQPDNPALSTTSEAPGPQTQTSKKRKAEDSLEPDTKRPRISAQGFDTGPSSPPSRTCTYPTLSPLPTRPLSLFLREDFRTHLCRCSSCYPILSAHPQLLEEEDVYEPPVSEEGDGEGSVGTGTGSLLERGEAALSNVDRVRAIGMDSHVYSVVNSWSSGQCQKTKSADKTTEGVMAYNHLKSRVKSFLQPFAESGTAVGAEDIKAYFEKLRGDDEAIRIAAMTGSGGGVEGDRRGEQGGKSEL